MSQEDTPTQVLADIRVEVGRLCSRMESHKSDAANRREEIYRRIDAEAKRIAELKTLLFGNGREGLVYTVTRHKWMFTVMGAVMVPVLVHAIIGLYKFLIMGG